MPELPEVETVARTLEPFVVGQTIHAIELVHKAVWQGSISPNSLLKRRIKKVSRRGKLLLIALEQEQTGEEPHGMAVQGLAFHLKMTGRLFAYPAGTLPEKHTRLIVDLDNATRIFFDDMRTFGYARAFSQQCLENWPFWQRLGPEPLELDEEAFLRLFSGKRRAMKALLLDQTVLAGIGNIYADESLFRAGIRPETPAEQVNDTKLRALSIHVRAVLEEAISACGSSIKDYRTARGDAGAFQNAFKVYGRAGKTCTVCGQTLQKSTVAGRTSVWCPHCQV